MVEQAVANANEEAENQPTDEQPGETAEKDIAWIVEAEIDAAVAGEARPKKDARGGEDDEQTALDETTQVERNEHEGAEGVGSVTGDEAIQATTTTAHEIDKAQ